MTYSDDEIALVVRGEKWCGRNVQQAYCNANALYPRYSGVTFEMWARKRFANKEALDALFVALLDKCYAEGVRYSVHTGEVSCVDPDGGGGILACRHPNRTLAFLLALDAAGYIHEH